MTTSESKPKNINAPQTENVLLIGGGGREHALAHALKQSPSVRSLHVTHAGNPGLAMLGTPVDVPVTRNELYRLRQYTEQHNIGLVVIGPEDPLAEGFADELASDSRLVFGPKQAAARLEADKAWAKDLMRSASIPCADGRVFSSAEAAEAYVETRDEAPVIKAAGLAKGKGVFVPETKAEAQAAIRAIMVDKAFGDAGAKVVIEERLVGREVSVLAITDGRTLAVLPPCQDHKRIGDGDTGPNTGGMGAYCPSDAIDDATMARIERDVLVPTIDALKRDGIDYRGVLYAGLMLTPGGPKVLEFNVRFGDPECQPLMARFRGDLAQVLSAACRRKLHEVEVEFDPRPSVCVVLASEGYPAKPITGQVIEGLDEADAMDDVTVFHAGTKLDAEGRVVTAGGRVLGVTALGDTLEDAAKQAYAACDKVSFPGMVMRSDIARASVSQR
ncbi:MAG: phosphoribosylamine--glycine ligase [Planctomycetota bacterium]